MRACLMLLGVLVAVGCKASPSATPESEALPATAALGSVEPDIGDPAMEWKEAAVANDVGKMARAEVHADLRKLSDGGRTFFIGGVGRDAVPAPRRFPSSAALTPAMDCCQGPGHQCDGAQEGPQWASGTWPDLKFGMSGPHHFRYEYLSSGMDGAATYTARAIGDIDCDGVFSTYEVRGYVTADGRPEAYPGVYTTNSGE